MSKEEKNRAIKQSILETRKRHQAMDCKTYEIKIINSKLNTEQTNILNAMFCEAKWLRNFHIANNINKENRNTRTVEVKVKDHYETIEIKYLGSQMIQDIFDKTKSEIKGLSAKKKNGDKIGKLKYKSVCNCLPLRQYGTTYRIIDHNHIKIQNIKKPFYVKGLKQIPKDAEITNAKLVRRVNGLYLYVTCFVEKEEKAQTNQKVGIDFGIAHHLNLSNGEAFDISIKENNSIKRLSKKINRSLLKNGNIKSHNHYKRVQKLQAAYCKQNNRKYDKANKVVSALLNDYDYIAIQDEMIANWHKGLFGKQVQNSCMGFIKAKLKQSKKVHVIPRSYPSTQICPICGCLTKHPLNKRTYDCEYCGYHHFSRDIKSAQSILDYALVM